MSGGHLLSSIAVTIKNYPLLLIGQVITNMGDDSYIVLYSGLLAVWFFEKETAFAFSMMTTSGFLMTMVIYLVLPMIYEESGSLAYCFWAVQIVSIFALICGFIVCYLDREADSEEKPDIPFSFAVLKHFNLGFWLLALCENMFNLGILLFLKISSDYFRERFEIDGEQAGFLIGLPQLTLAFTTFLIGLMVYRVGHKTHLSVLFIFLTGCGLITLVLLPNQIEYAIAPYILSSLFAMVVLTSTNPSYPYIVDQEYVSIAFGVAHFVWNIIYIVGPILLGYIHDNTTEDKGYFWVGIYIVGLTCISLMFAIALHIWDQAHGKKLAIPEYTLQYFLFSNL